MVIARARALYDAFGSLIHEVAKFGLVGAVNVVVDWGIFNALRLGVLSHKPLTAKVISTSVAIVSSYFMNRHWTWRERERHGLARELPLFFLLSGVGMVIAVACMGFAHYVLDQRSVLADNISGNVVGLLLGMAFRFWAYRKWVFVGPTPEAGKQAAEETLETTA